MAAGTFYGTNYTKAKDPPAQGLVDSNAWGGKVRCCYDQIICSADIESGSLCYVGKLPKGCIPLFTIVTPIRGNGIGTASANAVTGSIGWSGDTDVLGTFTTLAATVAAQYIRPVPDGTIYTGLEPLTEAKNVYITTGGATLVYNATASSNEGIDVKIFYMIE